VGDLGNIVADADGNATIDITDSRAVLSGPHSIIGRSIVVHAKADQFTQPSGDAGPRVAFGVIGVAAGEG
jgi:Cu-Zn family superoxide dismutase